MSIRSDFRAMALTASGLSFAAPALLMASAASAQYVPGVDPSGAGLPPLPAAEMNALPREYRTGPVMADRTETTIGADGVETITRTRYIPAQSVPLQSAPMQHPMNPTAPYPGGPAMYQPAPMAYAAQPIVFERQQWIDECRNRTAGRSRRDRGTIIGGLLGAIGGGIAGNRIAGVGDRLLGTAVGGVAGAAGGALLGSLFNGRKRDRYECEAALDSYLSQGVPVTYGASRTIPQAATYAYPVMMQPAYYAPPPPQVVVPVRYEQQQQVVVRETMREEIIPGAVRYIAAPRPTKLIKAR